MEWIEGFAILEKMVNNEDNFHDKNKKEVMKRYVRLLRKQAPTVKDRTDLYWDFRDTLFVEKPKQPPKEL